MAAENYHLKWDSHLSYLNNSIATLYKNEKFADVMLYTSYSNNGITSDIPTVGIPAHKFILSSCSQFFATMFETSPITAPNGVLYVVLPPDLSHRAIQILVQYMYSGEATVSNDILTEVLRGGEILKIRGLCRTSSSSSGQHLHHQRGEPSALYLSNGARSSLSLAPPPPMSTQLPSDIYGNKPSSSSSARYSLDHHHTHSHSHPHSHSHQHHHQHQQFRGLGASVMPKDSPVIVKSPRMASHTGLLSVASSSKLHATGIGGISVNKDVAIDPEDKCCYAPSSTQIDSLPQSSAAPVALLPPPMSICTEVGCSSCPLAAPSTEPADSTLRRLDYGERDRLIEDPICDRDRDRERDDVGIVYERRLRRERSCERGSDHEYFPHDGSHYEHVVKSYEVPAAIAPRLATPPHPHSFLTIKQEPTDWSNQTPTPLTNDNSNELSQDAILSPKQPLDFKMNTVKLEANAVSQDESEEHTLRDYNNFKLHVCEICQKSFDDTKSLVRHLGTHGAEPAANVMAGSASGPGSTSSGTGHSNMVLRALKTYVPKKRRRVSVSAVGPAVLDKPLSLPIPHSHSQQQENNMDHVTLLCDLCSTSFETPAEWVRHMNSQHTEIELAMFNSKKDGEMKGSSSSNSNSNSSSTSSVSQMQQTAASSSLSHKKYINARRQVSQTLSSRVGTISTNSNDPTSTSPGLTVVSKSSQA